MQLLKLLVLLLPIYFLNACTQPPSFADSRSRPQATPVAARKFTWTDRRAIGTIFLGNSPAYTPNNPRKWLNAKDLNLSTPAGKAEFRKRMMGLADYSIHHLRQLNAQGMIVFDIEGIEAPDAIYTWVGDPRLLSDRAPEMNEIADEFFRRFTDAGFRVGVTIRAQMMYPYKAPLPSRWWEKDRNLARYWGYPTEAAAIKDMREKIAYAKKRWGATLFYLDSNNYKWTNVIAKLQQQFPDILLIPEHTNNDPTYLDFSAPLERVDYWKYELSREHRRQRPNGFKAIFLRDPKYFEQKFKVPLYDYLLPKVQAGDVLMINVWYPERNQAVVRKLYRDVYGARCCIWTRNNRRS